MRQEESGSKGLVRSMPMLRRFGSGGSEKLQVHPHTFLLRERCGYDNWSEMDIRILFKTYYKPAATPHKIAVTISQIAEEAMLLK